MNTIWVPAAPLHHLLEVKRSKFHCHIQRAESAQAANLLITRLRHQYPDANHVCSAFIAGTPGEASTSGCSDDGEPSGCAGKPMLNVLLHSDLSCVVAAVARIFGGTKLGTGGLARAYGGAVSEALMQLEREQLRIMVSARYELAFEFESQARHLISLHEGIVESVTYSEQVELHVSVDEIKLTVLSAELCNACGGKCRRITPPQ